jgi:acylglycerol lipase
MIMCDAEQSTKHGRSSGLHVYIPTAKQLLDGVEAVLVDVDSLSDTKRKTFFVGTSMGAGIA